MRRFLPRLALLGAIAYLAACSADAPPVPMGPTAPPQLSHVPQAWYAYDADAIRRTGGTIFTTADWKPVALPLFNEAEKQRKAGRTDRARALYYEFLAYTLDKYKKNLLQMPSNFPSAKDGVFFIFASTLSGAGDGPVDHLRIVLDNVSANEVSTAGIDTRYQLCVIFNVAAETECGNPAGTAANVLKAHFLERPALFLIEPWGSIADYADFGSTWSDNWRMRVEPIQAQDAYAAPFGPNMSEALASVCGDEQVIADYPADHDRKEFHPPVSLLRVAQAPEGVGDTELLEKVTDALYRGKLAAMLDGCNNVVAARNDAPSPESYLARRGAYAWHVAQATLSRWAAPQAAYAVDGGLGGRTTLYRSFFAGVEPPSLYIRSVDPTAGPYHADNENLPATLATQSTTTVYASQTAYGTLVTPASCTWASSSSRIMITASGTGMATAELRTTGNTGTATVTATCTLTTGAQQQASVTFTVGS